jgi:twitching motility protein PilT
LKSSKNTKAVANLIREGKVHQIASAMQTGSRSGMVLFEKYIEDLVKKGKVSNADARTFLGKDVGESIGTPGAHNKAG